MTRYEQYLICKTRGHVAGPVTLTSYPAKSVCNFCGTWFWWTEPQLQEGNVPKEGE